jgi:hypothetical protein
MIVADLFAYMAARYGLPMFTICCDGCKLTWRRACQPDDEAAVMAHDELNHFETTGCTGRIYRAP